MTSPSGEYKQISTGKSDAVMVLLLTIADGPAEAYGILITCLYRMNFEFIERPNPMEDFILEIANSMRSVTQHKGTMQ